MPANQTRTTLQIVPFEDDDPTEGDELVVATFYSDNYYINYDSGTTLVTIHDDTPYNRTWLSQYSSASFTGKTAAPTADPDGDGVPNLLEFAFNTNPTFADATRSQPVVGTLVLPDPVDATPRRYPTLTFTRRTDAPTLAYTVQVTGDLAAGTWSGDGVVLVSRTTAGVPVNTERVVYRSTTPLDGPSASPSQLLRVRVSSTP